MRNALNSFSSQEIACGEWMTNTMRELSRLGHTVEPRNDFSVAWQRLGEKHPLKVTLIEGYLKLLSLGFIVPWPSIPEHKDRHRITEEGKRWARSEGPVPDWGS